MSDQTLNEPGNADGPIRSLLFVPAHRTGWAQKAALQHPDGVILDLEDAVPAEERGNAQRAIAESARFLRSQDIAPFVRINEIGKGGLDDVRAAVTGDVAAVILPKADSVEEIKALADLLSYIEGKHGARHGSIRIQALPETAQGMQFGHDLVKASARVRGLMTGVAGPVNGDIARAFGFEPSMEGSEQLFLQSKLILDSRSAGAEFPVGGVYGTPLEDLAAVELLVRRAKRLGFSGCAVMHPTHIRIVNEVFRPSAELLEQSRALIEAVLNAQREGKGAVRHQGVMVDQAMVVSAMLIVEEGKRVAAKARRSA